MKTEEEELLVAAKTGDVERLLRTLEREYTTHYNPTDPKPFEDAFNNLFSIRDSEGNTLLHLGAPHEPVVDALLRYNFPVDSTHPSGNTALHLSVAGNHFNSSKMLLLYGAAILKNDKGKTAIDIANDNAFQPLLNFFDTFPRTRKTKEVPLELELPINNSNKKRLIVGISGATCSGKSTLTRSLVKHFNCSEPYHHLDKYWKEFDQFPRDQGFIIGEIPDCLEMNLFLEDLKKKKYGVDEILFVDGFLLFHNPEICDMLDLKIFLQVSEDECRRRRKSRNLGTSRLYHDKIIWPSYIKYNGLYATQPVGPMGSDTLILDGNKSMDVVLQEAVQFIASKK